VTQSPATYRAIRLSGLGGLDRLEEVRLPLLDPRPGEVRVRVIAAGAGATDLTMRRGRYPFAPPFPFVPGYEVVGIVDAVGTGVTRFALGQKVAALTVHGAFAEYLVRGAEHFTPVPAGLDDGETVALVLNYGTAWQMIHRVAKLRAGQTALVTGANGGVGTALLDLLRDAKVRVLGACSDRHGEVVRSLGGEPIPSRGAPLHRTVRSVLPEGVDAAFDILGGSGTRECVLATKRGGVVVGYGFMGTVVHGSQSRWLTLRGFASLLVGARLRRRRGAFYGITLRYRRDPRPYREDLATLLALLASRRIAPRITHRLPLLAVRRSQELLEAGGVAGKIVLLREAGLDGGSEQLRRELGA
jgi:NADPH:quinone reductase-like Zn-dependent oxidoreductase